MKLKHLFFALATMLLAYTAQAQVKVGSNPGTIGTNSNLEVESTSGSKVVIDKTTGNMGVGTATPGNTVEIKSTTANASGLRLTNLNNSTSGVTGNAKGLGVNSTGDVVVLESNAVQIYVPTLKASLVGYSTSATFATTPISFSAVVFNSIPNASVAGTQINLPAGLYRANITFASGFSTATAANIATASLSVNGSTLQAIASYTTSGANVGAYSGVVVFELLSPGYIQINNYDQAGGGTYTLYGGINNSSISIEKLQ